MNITTNIAAKSPPAITEGQVFRRNGDPDYMMLAQVNAGDYKLIHLNTINRQDDKKWNRHEHTVASIEAYYGADYIGIPLKCHLEF